MGIASSANYEQCLKVFPWKIVALMRRCCRPMASDLATPTRPAIVN